MQLSVLENDNLCFVYDQISINPASDDVSSGIIEIAHQSQVCIRICIGFVSTSLTYLAASVPCSHFVTCANY
jgi:hypothetical protein